MATNLRDAGRIGWLLLCLACKLGYYKQVRDFVRVALLLSDNYFAFLSEHVQKNQVNLHLLLIKWNVFYGHQNSFCS
ncbi:hypothetical protein E3983_03630 [Legionella israelensis]|uniref:Uncharacterized protein n=1 Tax=Legionella israelensis TaxID=454 RepID=A0A0W0VIS9_9GAMM|nr:hypothetical protein [Legionella israelensis]KTD19641.1 hypothetical protein Lisr_1927 [Legionella israelensis]QBR83527.1 hypothetical protein E3983_03630 [Legionella israelensis]SCY09129.1 hypothetical protein SAMN02746069_01258 [Legionella israelensis DSM 19235]STX58817.1 Uncharacterised protein [Legionella israelensis]